MQKTILILIQSTDATITGFQEKGLWERQYFTIENYLSEFDVYYYTSDSKTLQNMLPNGSVHKVAKYASGIYGLRHILFYIYLLQESFKWKKLNCVIRVFGVNLPILPFLKLISSKKIVSSFQYDWAEQTNKNYGLKDIKKHLASFIQYNSLKYSNSIISTMAWLEEKVQKSFPKKSTIIIPNYVNTDIFTPKSKKKQIVFAGRLHWSKGVDTLIETFINFNKSYNEYKLIILGDGVDRQKLENLASNNKNILFKGNVSFSNVANYFNESEIFVLPTKTMEGHPKALIEAMASGCKCITSNVPGNKDVLEQSDTKEYIFDPQNSDDLLKKIQFALQDDVIFKKQYHFALNKYDSKILFKKEIKFLKNNLKDENV